MTVLLQSGSPFGASGDQPFQPIAIREDEIIGNAGCDFNADGFTFDFNAVLRHVDTNSRSNFQFPNHVFSVSTFKTRRRPGRESGRVFRGPGYANTDLNIVKKTKIPWFVGEDANVQFRAEFFNLFNRVNLTNPDGNIGSPVFGSSTSSYGARNVQFGVKIQF
jgi:hypothetical protein